MNKTHSNIKTATSNTVTSWVVGASIVGANKNMFIKFRIHLISQIFFCSVKNLNILFPPSLPKPEFFNPPKGVRKSLTIQQLIQITPASIFLATLLLLSLLFVQTVAESPKQVSFAISIASSSDFNCKTIGLSSGASAPEELVQNFISEIKNDMDVSIEEVVTAKEKVVFKLPKELN